MRDAPVAAPYTIAAVRGARSAARKEPPVQPNPHEHVQYATLGWRAAAVLIDTLIVLLASSVVLAVLTALGVLDLGLSQAFTVEDIVVASRAVPGWLTLVEYGIVFVYFTLFELTGATPGKRVFKLTVLAEDGSRAGAGAVVIRNAVRLPEMYLLYIPSAISCAVSSRRKRLGDFAGRTVVVRRAPAPYPGRAGARPQAGAPFPPEAAPPAPALPSAAGAAGTAASAEPDAAPSLDDALTGLRSAALAVLGAHHLYLRFSEEELARGGGEQVELSEQYAAAWYSLADAVVALQRAHDVARRAAAAGGTTLQAACADQAELLHLFRELAPYFTAASDEDVHEAYLMVARGETSETGA